MSYAQDTNGTQYNEMLTCRFTYQQYDSNKNRGKYAKNKSSMEYKYNTISRNINSRKAQTIDSRIFTCAGEGEYGEKGVELCSKFVH